MPARPPWLSLVLLLASGAITALANPVLLSERPRRLQSENVRVLVRQNDSLITGDYVFVATATAPERGIPLVTLLLPVILPKDVRGEAWQEKFVQARARVLRSRNYHLRMRAVEFGSEEEKPVLTDLPPLPPGWKYALLPFSMTYGDSATLRVRITYRQPHLPGQVAPYVPILPDPDPAGRYSISFLSESRRQRLKPVGSWNGTRDVRRGRTVWTTVPRHHELLRMKVLR